MPASALMGLTLLVIGDSHLATPSYLIGTLPDRLVEEGAKVHTIGVCGTNPADWVKPSPGDCGMSERTGAETPVRQESGAKTTAISELIAKDKPNAVIVVMGDTIGAYKNPEFPKSWAYQQTSALTKAIAATGTACYWVGPGWGSEGSRYGKTFARVDELNKFLSENVAPCTYIDSTKMAQPNEWKTLDGQHYLGGGYKKWANAIADAIISNPPK
ncbi:MAG: SGNH/GDSL hydrolase family protein [Halothiobacillaceae bacterium]|jgi:hypothetical protein|nr:MAG: SGNH/GDSL hydrolase family protein [Halothiobacillaceae bacterium]